MKHVKTFESMGTSKFIVALHQDNGCDYTIECGTKVSSLTSTNINDANEEVAKLIEEEYTGERSLSRATIFEVVNQQSVDLETIYSNISNKKKLAKEREIEDKERSDWERLNKKFGGK